MLTGIGHAAYRIRNLDAMLEFYCGQLGLKEAFRLNHPDSDRPWIVYVQIARDQFLEFFPQGPEAELTVGNQFVHLCLTVDDVAAEVATLQARGVSLYREIGRGRSGCIQAFIQDPEGNLIELMQIEPGSLQARAAADWER